MKPNAALLIGTLCLLIFMAAMAPSVYGEPAFVPAKIADDSVVRFWPPSKSAKAVVQGVDTFVCGDRGDGKVIPCYVEDVLAAMGERNLASDGVISWPPKPQHPECVTEENGGRYKVYEMSRKRTMMAGRPARWDEDGNYYPATDPNYYIVTYRCDNWHIWTVEEK